MPQKVRDAKTIKNWSWLYSSELSLRMVMDQHPVIPRLLANLALFEPTTISHAVHNGFMDKILPNAGASGGKLAGGSITFQIAPAPHFINFDETYVFIRGRFTGKQPARAAVDGGVAARAEMDVNNGALPFGFVNLLSHSLFKSIQISLNGKSITFSDDNYGYKAYLQTLLNYPPHVLDTYFRLEGWYKDKTGDMNTINGVRNANTAVAK